MRGQWLRNALTPDRYTPRKLARSLRNPQLVRTELNRLGVVANQFYYRYRDTNGIRIPDQEWDVLVVLDGCRYDLFAEVVDQFVVESDEFTFEQVRSRGSHSRQFLMENFGNDTHHDTVYVSANPFVFRRDDGVFHSVRNLLRDEWDETLGTVPPDAVADAGVDWIDRYPNKRVIIHFMQPHFPFIGERGRQLKHRDIHPDDIRELQGESDDPDVGGKIIWDRLQHGEVSLEEVWACYRENLELIVPHVTEIVDAANGTVVVTSDHGNLLGERLWPIPVRGYGHPQDLHVSELVNVPWLRIDRAQQRDIVSEPPQPIEGVDNDVITERLSDLGYK